jgi:hypothetical protein
MTSEHKAKIAAANAARKGKANGKCPEGCTCARHRAYYRGGSEKGRTFSDQARENISRGAQERQYSPEETQRRSDQVKAQHADPEWAANRISAVQEACTGVRCLEGCTCERHSEEVSRKAAAAHLGTTHSAETKTKIGEGSKAAWARKTPEERSQIAWDRIQKYGVSVVSKTEYVLAPFLAALGYMHNDDRALVVGRKFPDFYDVEGNRLFEYFGNHWHPRWEEEAEVIGFYQALGWECTVLWESDIFGWLKEHEHLVTAEQYEGTLKIASRLTGLSPV